MDKKIFVVYVGIGSCQEDKMINEILKGAYDAISPVFKDQNAEVIFIPTRTIDSKIECINPKYITNKSLIEENELYINKLHKSLDLYLNNIIKKEKNNE